MNRWTFACAAAALIVGATTETALAQERRQRTEAEARAAAERNRAERARLEAETGQPVALIHDYVLATVGPVPESLDVDPFYQKYVDAGGIPVLASTKVPDIALLVVRDIINTMLAARSDLRASMIERNWRTGVIAEVEMTMDIPEYSRMKRPGAPRDEPVMQADRDYHANRSRGLGGNPTTGAEENILGYPGTRYFGEHIFVHEFAHAVHRAIRDVDPGMAQEISDAYDAAMAGDMYRHPDGRRHYATTNRERVLGRGRAVVVLLQLRGVLRRGREGGVAGGIRGLRPRSLRAHRPRLQHAPHPHGHLPRETDPAGGVPGGTRRIAAGGLLEAYSPRTLGVGA